MGKGDNYAQYRFLQLSVKHGISTCRTKFYLKGICLRSCVLFCIPKEIIKKNKKMPFHQRKNCNSRSDENNLELTYIHQIRYYSLIKLSSSVHPISRIPQHSPRTSSISFDWKRGRSPYALFYLNRNVFCVLDG